jgi:formyltetrahydrofolate-dependent phosphoribosylglycinamide formyltransferase
MTCPRPLNLAVLISSGGTTLQNFIDRIGDGSLPAHVRLVVSSRADAFGLERARHHGIPSVVCASREHKGFGELSRAVWAEIARRPVDLVCLAGYMCFLRVPDGFIGRVMNIHPALIPAFCGKGMYGHRVHEAVLEHGCKASGCTVHFVDNQYDHGPIIVQRTVPVSDTDTPDTLAARVFEQECVAYPEAIRLFAAGRLRIEGRVVRVLPEGRGEASPA